NADITDKLDMSSKRVPEREENELVTIPQVEGASVHNPIVFSETRDPSLSSSSCPLPTTSSSRLKLYHPIEKIIGNPKDDTVTWRKTRSKNEITYVCCTFSLEPKKVEEALCDEHWVLAM
ncbi:hypothetical protein U1Q18_022755, partial [Sarracenia purpurea var. burkii]